jgi:copper chaperone CopZ
MKTSLLLIVSLIIPLWNLHAETIDITVNGMVCSFCAQGIEKKIKKISAVSTIAVDMDTKVVTIVTKDKQTIPDETLRKIIVDSGFAIKEITRRE